MPMNTLADLFHETLRDVYYAEKKLLKALPKMAKNASDESLAAALTDHLTETEGQVERLEQVFEMIGKPARGKKCEAMEGLVAEGEEVIEDAEEDSVKDAGLIAAAQAVEHYEIARYGALVAWANELALAKAIPLLEKTLEEEKGADSALSELATKINSAASMEAEAA
jgi:ferritin-like metal-binding protein YciE